MATRPVIPAMSATAIRAVRALEERLLALPQVPIETRHVLHAGMYARTICVPAGVMLTGVLIRIPTLLIVSGHATVFIGEEDVELSGYAVIPASAGREQAIYAPSQEPEDRLRPRGHGRAPHRRAEASRRAAGERCAAALFEVKSVADARRLLREHPGEIARAIGIESMLALTVGLIAIAALGPVGGAVAFTGTSGVDGYANGLVGALARAGVDVSNAEELTRALQDKALMERVRKDATTDGAIAAGVTAAATMTGIRRSSSAARTAAKTSNAPSRAGDDVKAIIERRTWVPEEIVEAAGSVGAARVWTIGSRLRANGLPTGGANVRYVPRKGYDPRNPVPRGERGASTIDLITNG